MKLSLMAAVSENGVIGAGPDIPWQVLGEQLLFKAMTYNQWLLVGRKTFESMGKLPHRQYAVVSRTVQSSSDPSILYFTSIDAALAYLSTLTDHVFVAGGGELYRTLIARADTVHLSTIHQQIDGDVTFPILPAHLQLVFAQHFHSNIDYTYQIWQRTGMPLAHSTPSGDGQQRI